MRLSLVFLLSAGCASLAPGSHDNTEVSFSAFPNLDITANSSSITATLRYGIIQEQSSPCPIASPALVGQLGESAMQVLALGGKIDDVAADDVSDNLCGPVILRLDMPPPTAPAVLQIKDLQTTLICNLPDLTTPRTLRVLAPASSEWRAGEQVTLAWSPGSDLDQESFHVVLSGITDGAFSQVVAGAVRDGDLLHVIVPAVRAGAYTINVVSGVDVLCTPSRSNVRLSPNVDSLPASQRITIVH